MAYEALNIPLHINMPNERLALLYHIIIFMQESSWLSSLVHNLSTKGEYEDCGWYKFWKYGRNLTGALHSYGENQTMPLPKITWW